MHFIKTTFEELQREVLAAVITVSDKTADAIVQNF
jgi:hypothetical protein